MYLDDAADKLLLPELTQSLVGEAPFVAPLLTDGLSFGIWGFSGPRLCLPFTFEARNRFSWEELADLCDTGTLTVEGTEGAC